MPNPKLETYKNKATGTVYDYTDAAAQAALAGILDGTDIDSFDDVETALATKVDKVTGKGLSTNDYDDTEKAKVAAAFPRSEQAVLGAVNLCPMKVASGTPSNLTITAVADGTFSVNGTAGGTDNYGRTSFTLNKGTYYLSGVTGGGANKYELHLKIGGTIDVRNYDGFTEFTIANDNTELYIEFNYRSGAVIDTTVKPMISLASDIPYVPHAMTNKELTTKHEIKDVAFAGGTGIDVRPATSVKIEDKLLSGYFALKNDTENDMASNTVIGTISGITVHHGANWVLPAIITDNMTNTAVMLSHDNTNNTITIKNQTSLPAGNVLAFSFTEYMLKA